MAQRDRPCDFLARGQDFTVRVGLHAKEAQDPAHQNSHRAHNRRKQENHHRNHGGDAGGGLFGIGDGIGFGQHFGKDQDQQGHDKRGKRHARFPKQAREQGGRQRGSQDIDHIIA